MRRRYADREEALSHLEEGAQLLGLEDRPLETILAGHRKLGLDTPVFIDQIEENARYVPWLIANSIG
jgi:hypothetical protein